MVDLLTVIPTWVTYHLRCPVFEEISTTSDGLLYFMFALTNTRILRILRIRQKLLNIQVDTYIDLWDYINHFCHLCCVHLHPYSIPCPFPGSFVI